LILLNSVVVVMEELRNLAKAGKAVVVVTHDPRLTEYADRIVEVKNGNAVPVALEALLK
jgi:putative ABC transport system ATP-binding protein